ncbi:MAG TPA: phosphoglucosamine mutase [Vicinamibacterales bacterium]|nr:phosphoglucosamine mutase [Vicinamibacterales bacterium]
MANNRLFGTDGVRGTAGQAPLDPPTVRRLGAALVRALPRGAKSPEFLIGRDTRESGGWIEAELGHGACGEGAAVTSAGVVPTPAVAFLTRTGTYDAGVVISASHNPFEDNGIKVFSGKGEKFTESVEREVEAIMADGSWSAHAGAAVAVPRADLVDAYLDHLRAVFPEASARAAFPIAIDCANGATTTVAPELFNSLGFETIVIGNRPDGRNINLGYGSTHPERLAETVVARGCAMGVAFDGDGDRAIFVDHHGRIVDGDAVLLMCGRQLQREGRLKGGAIVATVMSNIGLELALKPLGIELVRTAVGDKYVMEEMLKRDLALGGEQSGHIIFSDYLFTGDGLCTALNVLRTIALSGRTLADLASDLTAYPQVLLNVRVRERVELNTVPAVAEAIARVEARVAGQGRVLIRYSGTEPLLRVMLEGQQQDQIRGWAQEIVDVVKEHLG